MRFHLIDRIDTWEPEKLIVAHKLTSRAEDYWTEGGVMPTGLLLETVCQAATWLLMLGSDFRRRAALLSVDTADYSGDVVPGDILDIEVSIASVTDEAAVIDGVVLVGGVTVLTASGIMCALLAADTLEDPAETRRMAAELCRTGVA